MKTCTKCKIDKVKQSFNKDNRRLDGLTPHCKDCKKAAMKLLRDHYRKTRTIPIEKQCSSCKILKPAMEFYKSAYSKSGLGSDCKDCQKVKSLVYYAENKEDILEKNREHHKKNRNHIITKSFARAVKRKYGLTYKQYQDRKVSQDYKCYICKKEESQLRVRLNLDHCHTTGKLRKFLCNKCNTGLGSFEDSTELLAKVIKYLQEHSNDNK